MTSLNDVLLAASNIPVADPIAEIWGRGLQGGYKIIEYTGSLPITINADGDALLGYRIYGADGGIGEPTENLFDPNAKNVDNGYIANSAIGYPNGEITDVSPRTWVYVTEYIPVDSNTNYIIFANLFRASVDWARGIVFYDENKNFISAILGYAALNEATYESGRGRVQFITPENCRYIRTNVDTGATMLMLVAASIPPPTYIPYGYKLPMTLQSANLFNGEITQGAYTTGTGVPFTSNRYLKSSKIRLDLDGYITLTVNCPKIGLAISGFDFFVYFWTETDTYINFFKAQEKERCTVQIPEGALYFAFSVGAGAGGTLDLSDISDIMLVEGSTAPTEYIPYSNQSVPVYIGENQLEEDEYVSYNDGKIYRIVDGTLTPTEPPVPLPEIPTIDGTTIIDYDGDPKPSQMYVKYKVKG